jgi:hypothetical protein
MSEMLWLALSESDEAYETMSEKTRDMDRL